MIITFDADWARNTSFKNIPASLEIEWLPPPLYSWRWKQTLTSHFCLYEILSKIWHFISRLRLLSVSRSQIIHQKWKLTHHGAYCDEYYSATCRGACINIQLPVPPFTVILHVIPKKGICSRRLRCSGRGWRADDTTVHDGNTCTSSTQRRL